MSNTELFERAKRYAEARSLAFDADRLLGSGQDGAIWRTTAQTAIKVFQRPETYSTELACYERLREHNVT